MRAKLLSALAGVACVGMLFAGVALAAGAVTKVTIRPPNSKYGLHGRVFSRKYSCTVGRTVEVLKAKGPHESPKTDTVIATTKSKPEGKFPHGFWKVSASPKAGWFYAYATKSSGCRAGVSPLLHLTGG